MVSKYADASTVMGDTQVDTTAINDLARGEYSRAVNERMPRDYVQMYHPDGSTSVVQLPTLSKGGKNVGDRQRKLMHYVLNKKASVKQPDGTMKRVQWWYPSPPPGWKAAEMPWRCPVQECTRAGGLKDLLNLWRHIKSKHPGEVELYQGVLTAIQKRLAEATAVNLDSLFRGGGNDGEQPLVSEADLEAAKFEDAANILNEMEAAPPPVAPETFLPDALSCELCDWRSKPDAQMPERALRMHIMVKHKKEEG
jgi:hypothetical protein